MIDFETFINIYMKEENFEDYINKYNQNNRYQYNFIGLPYFHQLKDISRPKHTIFLRLLKLNIIENMNNPYFFIESTEHLSLYSRRYYLRILIEYISLLPFYLRQRYITFDNYIFYNRYYSFLGYVYYHSSKKNNFK